MSDRRQKTASGTVSIPVEAFRNKITCQTDDRKLHQEQCPFLAFSKPLGTADSMYSTDDRKLHQEQCPFLWKPLGAKLHVRQTTERLHQGYSVHSCGSPVKEQKITCQTDPRCTENCIRNSVHSCGSPKEQNYMSDRLTEDCIRDSVHSCGSHWRQKTCQIQLENRRHRDPIGGHRDPAGEQKT